MRFPRPFLRTPRPAALAGAVLVLLPIATVLWVHTAAAAPQQSSPGDLDGAIAFQQQRIAEDPGSAEAYNDLGNLLALRQDRAAAEDAYREALRLDPSSFSAHFNLAVLLRTGHRPGDAIKVLEQALELEPESAWAHYQLGAAHQALGHRKRATNAYARAFALDNRLALPDVNPLVIGNPLVTAAMLTRQDVPVPDTTPRSYADPVTISQLLLPPVEPETETEPEAEAGTEPAAATAETITPPSAQEAEPPPTVPPASGPRPPATVTAAPPTTSEPDARTQPRTPEGLQILRPEDNKRRITGDDLRSLRVLNQAQPQPGATPPPEGGSRERTLQAPQRFRPGRRSSAQLDLEIVPRSLTETSRSG